MAIPDAAAEHFRQVQRIQVLAVSAGRRSWDRVDPRFLSETWTRALVDLAPVISAVQVQAAEAGAAYGAATLAEQGSWVAPSAFVDPKAFGGVAADGRSLAGLLYSPITSVKNFIGGGLSPAQSLALGRGGLDTMIRSTVVDAGRQASSVDLATREGVGYIRLEPAPSCPKCLVLAGKWYRWNTGFRRHPRCDGVHVPSTAGSVQNARDAGLISDPYEHFRGLSKADQDKTWGAADAQAIRDGGDIYRITNARRGAHAMTTTEGTTRRGFAASQRRLTPDGIYAQGKSRAETLDLLREHGYLLPGGQVAGGVVRGQIEGFGALGRGGTRAGARSVVEQARMTGVRDGSRYTMTAAERRLHDAEQRYGAVLRGENPYVRGGKGLTPELSARAEKDYRRWLNTGGQVLKH